MAFDLSSVLSGIGGLFGGGGQAGATGVLPGSFANMLSGGQFNPAMLQRLMSQGQGLGLGQGQGQGFGLGQMLPGAGQMPGQGVQLPGMAQGQGYGLGQSLPGLPNPAGDQVAMPQAGGTFMDVLGAGLANRDVQKAMMAMSQGGQQPQQPQQQPGALPVAGASAMAPRAGGIGQGYMAQGGGIAPRRILRR